MENNNKFTEVEIGNFIENEAHDFDIYLKVKDSYVLYRNKNTIFTEENLLRLKESGVKSLFISANDLENYYKYIENHLSNIIKNPNVILETKVDALYNSSKLIIDKIFHEPRLLTNINKLSGVVDNTISLFEQNQKVFINIINMNNIDKYTYHHSLNVGIFAISFGYFLGIYDKRKLLDLGLAGMLHDLGKSYIDKNIIEKPMKLDKEEWRIIKKHPEFALMILRASELIHDEVRYAILQHHENIDGSGYPGQLKQNQISYFARIIRIIDVFDAITSDRPYSKAKNTFDALKLMSTEMSNKLDVNLLKKFILMLHK